MRGISPLVGFALVLGITTFLSTLAIVLIKPLIEKHMTINLINEASSNLDLLTFSIREVASEAPGSRRTIYLSASGGYYDFDKNRSSIIFSYFSPQKIDLLGRINDKFLSIGTIFFDFFSTNTLQSYKIVTGTWKIKNRLEGINGTLYIPFYSSYSSVFLSSKFASDSNLAQIFIEPTPENLALYWTFDEVDENTVYDYSGAANHGTTEGSLTHVDGIMGKAVRLNSSSDAIVVTPVPNLEVNSFTVSLWFKAQKYIRLLPLPRDFRGELLPSSSLILKTGISENSSLWEIYIRNETLRFDLIDPIGSYDTISIEIEDNKWYHLIAVVSNTSIQLWIDGVKKIEANRSVGDIRNNESALYLGSISDHVLEVDELKIYNRSLNEEEIKTLYEQRLKKLLRSGTIYISNFTNASIVMSNPLGKMYVSEIVVGNLNSKEINLIQPIYDVEIKSFPKIGKGNYKIIIENVGFDTVSKKPIIEIKIG